MAKKICIIAGEPSGDMYGSRLIREIKKIEPDTEVFGIGGDKMEAEGVKLLYHIRQLSFMGFLEIIKNLAFINSVMGNLTEYTKKSQPDIIILIDYPGFNLKFARKIRKYSKKIYYYISPQVWAWGKKRVKKMQYLIDKIIVIFPFEKEFFKEENVEVDFVGHPLLEIISEFHYRTKEEFYLKYKFEQEAKIISIFPGSRLQEIKKHFPALKTVIRELVKESKINIGIAVSQNIPLEFYRDLIINEKVKLVQNDQYNLLKYSEVVIVKSGTSTVEAACFEKPMVIFYKSSFLNYFIGKMLVNVKFFGMVNIIAGKKIVPEILQNEVNPENILKHCREFLTNDALTENIKQELRIVKDKLGNIGASRKAAEIILNNSY